MVDFFLASSAVIAAQFVGLVFLFAGTGKLFSRSSVIHAVQAYGLLPRSLSRLVGTVLPWLELAIAASLLTGLASSWVAIAALLLLFVFSVAQAIVLVRGQEVPCGCFGSLSTRPVRWRNVLANLGLVLASLAATGCAENSVGQTAADRVQVLLLAAAALLQLFIFRQILENRAHWNSYLRYLRELSAAVAIQRIGSDSLP